jgi:hypothetical protein
MYKKNWEGGNKKQREYRKKKINENKVRNGEKVKQKKMLVVIK